MYLQNTIGQKRLTGLPLLNICKNVIVHPLQIVIKQAQHRQKLYILVEYIKKKNYI